MTITNKMLNDMLDKYDTDILIKWTDTATMRKLLKILYSKNYNFICNYKLDLCFNDTEIKKQVEKDFYSFYHKSSVIFLHIFYNPINNKNEIQFTNLTNIRTYPQYKNKKYYLYFG